MHAPSRQMLRTKNSSLGCQVTRSVRPPSRTSWNASPAAGSTLTLAMAHRRCLQASSPVLDRMRHHLVRAVDRACRDRDAPRPRLDGRAVRAAGRRGDEDLRPSDELPEHAGARALRRDGTRACDGFACRAAVVDDDTLVGFGYGYTTAPGQWWHDLVRKALDDETAAEWLHDAFELSELHMLPEFQGGGTGRELLRGWPTSCRTRRCCCRRRTSTRERSGSTAHLGFVDLRRHYLFPGEVAAVRSARRAAAAAGPMAVERRAAHVRARLVACYSARAYSRRSPTR